MVKLITRIEEAGSHFAGDLSFLNNWTFFAYPESHFEQLTTTGPYAGTLEAFTTGVKLRTRYQQLFPSDKAKKIRYWASDSKRVIETARYFAAGFFGLDWNKDAAELQVIPETEDLGADTLTPSDTCTKYLTDTDHGHDHGWTMLIQFRNTYLGPISDRLSKMASKFHFTNEEVFSMQEMCGFETLTRGSSPWCSVFTHDDWLNFEYARDVIHFYRAGPGNPYGPTMGWLWINATMNILLQGEEAGPFFFSL
jgi:acid phosphatase